MGEALKIWMDRDGKLLRLRLDRPRANIIDAQMISALGDALGEYENDTNIIGVLIDASGPNFSYGASVEEHLPQFCTQMLKSFHALVIAMLQYPVPILVVIHGQCLGGGLEVALAGQLLFASDKANLGQPEMQLGVFAPAASCLLPERISQSAADDLLFSGRSVSGQQALAMGLVDFASPDPHEQALEYFDKHLANKSASSMRMAVKAARIGFCARVIAKLDAVERLYLEQLMSTHDAVEGLLAFIAKRPAKWENR